MIELNVWFFVQLANFLILLFLLNMLLFRPLLHLFQARKDTIEEALRATRTLNEKKDRELAHFQNAISSARDHAQEVYRALRLEGLTEQKKTVTGAQEEALKEIEKARALIRQETEVARQRLSDDVRMFSDEIVKKLMKV